MTPLPPGWTECSLRDVALSVKNGIFVSRAGTEPIGVPILRISSVRSLRLDLNDIRYSARTVRDLAKLDVLLSDGDLLFTRYNGSSEYVGVCAVVPSGIEPLTYPDKLIRVRVDRRLVEPRYLGLMFASQPVRQQLRKLIHTTAGQSGISGRDLASTVIRLPPMAEQCRIISGLDGILAQIDHAQRSIERLSDRANSLKRSLLGEAFAGRLVSQDLSDEPAAMLLERIKADRAAVPKPRRVRKARAQDASVERVPGARREEIEPLSENVQSELEFDL